MAAVPPANAPVTKREPVAIATAVVTLLATFMFVAADLGIDIPDKVQEIVTLVGIVAAGFGVRSRVTPVAAPKLR